MHVVGEYQGATRTLEGETLICFCVDDSELTDKLAKLEGEEVALEIKKKNAKRSLTANGYMWKLCSLMAQAIGSDKDSVYQMMLSRYGVFEDIECTVKAVDHVKSLFRYYEEFYEDFLGASNKVTIRGYFGSHSYDTKEMSYLIDGIVRECKEIGVETWNQEEIDRLMVKLEVSNGENGTQVDNRHGEG